MLRVVSLVPSVTETLLAWGVVPIACTRFCEQPSIAHVGGTKDPDVRAIRALVPDLVVLDEEENRREDYEALRASGLEVLALAVRSVPDVRDALEELAARLGIAAAGHPRLLEAWPKVAGGDVRRAFVPIWRRPWIALGAPTYGASLLAGLGIASVHADDGPYPPTTLEEAASRRPDLVIAPSEPYPFSLRQRAELETVAPACFVDGKDLFWWGVRTVGAPSRLAAALEASLSWPQPRARRGNDEGSGAP